MDLNSLRDQVSNLTLYDIKAGVRKVQNAVMNYTEMESKVREATNNEPWGASTTLMQEISSGTNNYQLLNEIMPMIYKRFTDKTAEEWRQIYKALQLLEFLIKNGSERVVDDARSHLSLLRMLRQFHFIDQNGKDQGVNVRNRAQELAKLLNDVDAIRAERKKARANRNKFGGVEGGGGFSSSSGSRYGGFGSEEQGGYGGYSGGVYGDGGGFGGDTGGFQDSGRKGDRFEEYDEDEEGAGGSLPAPSRKKEQLRAASLNTIKRNSAKTELSTQKPKEPEVDLFDFGDDEPAISTSNGKAPASVMDNLSGLVQSPPQAAGAEDEDFDDFQSAPVSGVVTEAQQPALSGLGLPPPTSTARPTSATTTFAAPQPVSAVQTPLNDLVGFSSMSPAPRTGSAITSPPSSNFSSPPIQPHPMAQPLKPSGYQAAQPNYFTSVQTQQNPVTSPPANARPGFPSTTSYPSATAAKPAAVKSSGDAFGNLWSTASVTAGIKKTTPGPQGPKLAEMAKAKSDASMWGAPAASSPVPRPTAPTPNTAKQVGGGMDDLLG